MKTSRTRGMSTAGRLPFAGAVLLAAGMAWPVGTAEAQPAPATTPPAGTVSVSATGTTSQPQAWVVTADNLLARSGDAYSFYPVAALKAGTAVQVDGERGGYLRIVYPAGLKVLVKAEEATLEAGTNRVKLSRASTLQAFNMTAGARASWNPLMDTALPPGTELVLVEEIKNDAGKVTHYGVQPPAGARAFVDRQGVRRATDAEVAAMTPAATVSSNPPAVVTPPPSTPPSTVAGTPATAPNTASTTTPPPAPGTTTTTTTVTSAIPSAPAIPGTTPTTTTTTITPPPPETVQVTTTVTSTPAPAPAPKVEEPAREAVLMALFNRLRTTPLSQVSTGEITEAIDQFETYRLVTMGDGSSTGRLGRVDGYVQVLTLMRDVKQARIDAEQSSASWSSRKSALAAQIAQFEKQRVYQVIGLLLPSAIYDGQSLPKFYRIQSPEPGTFRTLGYIAPQAGLDLDGKVGNVIGIIGSTQWDESLKAPMVTAQRVDVVSLAAISGSPASAAEILGQQVPGGATPGMMTPGASGVPAPSGSPTSPMGGSGTTGLMPGTVEVKAEPEK